MTSLKRISGLLSVLFLAAMICLCVQGCSKDKSEDPTSPGGTDNTGQNSGNSITLNGGPFNNVTYDFGSVTSGALVTAGYDVQDNETVVFFKKDTISVTIEFHGNAAGDYSWTSLGASLRSTVMVNQYKTNAGNDLRAAYISIESKGKTTVTAFANKGGKVKGSFSGQILHMYGAGDPITVSGSFDAICY